MPAPYRSGEGLAGLGACTAESAFPNGNLEGFTYFDVSHCPKVSADCMAFGIGSTQTLLVTLVHFTA